MLNLAIYVNPNPNPHPHSRPLPAPATSTRESRPATFRHTRKPKMFTGDQMTSRQFGG